MIEKTRNIRKRVFALFLMFLCLQTLGCRRDDVLLLSEEISTEDTEESEEFEETEETDSDELRENSEKETAETEASEVQSQIVVYVCGAVKSPGVYFLDGRSRVYEAVEKAGGLKEDAASWAINLADCISDGQMIYIPNSDEAAYPEGVTLPVSAGDSEDGVVNINTADENELMTLNGIGEQKAKSIIEYRNTNGDFENACDIMNVSGIGEGCYQKIKDNIKVR
ncbi:MAG: helix-hairpin-helix domain-containing protein [Lachnospiraceae bacterium]|nr:helix-hairpin-helix domain-containing protein [Lachnospiraceae bacterium]